MVIQFTKKCNKSKIDYDVIDKDEMVDDTKYEDSIKLKEEKNNELDSINTWNNIWSKDINTLRNYGVLNLEYGLNLEKKENGSKKYMSGGNISTDDKWETDTTMTNECVYDNCRKSSDLVFCGERTHDGNDCSANHTQSSCNSKYYDWDDGTARKMHLNEEWMNVLSDSSVRDKPGGGGLYKNVEDIYMSHTYGVKCEWNGKTCIKAPQRDDFVGTHAVPNVDLSRVCSGINDKDICNRRLSFEATPLGPLQDTVQSICKWDNTEGCIQNIGVLGNCIKESDPASYCQLNPK